ncbi:MAG TPA: tRNA 2-thiouridine(34) synthase MnmA [Steroidobacteraceae bacterium]|jgi:tRNA-specific 2-thiouridylase|nr:tRNA 2-thiouridine(34) synthase MnmA [Steroidobacteraceae bacterium]
MPTPSPAAPAARTRVIVGLSGGVDSAVAALLLKDSGWDVHALFMSNWEEDDDAYCTAAQDFQDARAVAAELGIPLHRMSFAGEYRERVFAHFLAEYAAGRTPNPDVLCNREIKFGVGSTWAQRLGAQYFATGHYARVDAATDGAALYKGSDPGKDQSYFLTAVPRAQLARTLMPLGGLHKSAVRERARRAGLPIFDKPDSTGICFIGERPFREFLARFLPRTPGPIETSDGEAVGEHQGLAFYTLGQRTGLNIGGRSGRPEAPWYVAAKDTAHNRLVVVQGHDHPLLESDALVTGPWHWLAPARREPFTAAVKVRYRQHEQAARLEPLADGTVRVLFDTPQRAVTPGQYAVAYEGERCLGGGVITAVSARGHSAAA